MHDPDNAASIATLRAEVRQLRDEVKESSDQTRALVEAWTTAVGLVRFVKVLSTLAAAVTAILYFVTHGFTRAP